jgi:hypothetical protein
MKKIFTLLLGSGHRQRLADETTASYQKGADGILDQMKTAAAIQVTSPEEN